MKTILAISLIGLGFVWLWYGAIVPKIMRNRAGSDAGQVMSDLYAWGQQKVSEGDLEEGDLHELFPEGYGSLKFGGESRERNFQQMIQEIAGSSAVPVWPGIFAVVLGAAGLFSERRKPIEKSP